MCASMLLIPNVQSSTLTPHMLFNEVAIGMVLGAAFRLPFWVMAWFGKELNRTAQTTFPTEGLFMMLSAMIFFASGLYKPWLTLWMDALGNQAYGHDVRRFVEAMPWGRLLTHGTKAALGFLLVLHVISWLNHVWARAEKHPSILPMLTLFALLFFLPQAVELFSEMQNLIIHMIQEKL